MSPYYAIHILLPPFFIRNQLALPLHTQPGIAITIIAIRYLQSPLLYCVTMHDTIISYFIIYTRASWLSVTTVFTL